MQLPVYLAMELTVTIQEFIERLSYEEKLEALVMLEQSIAQTEPCIETQDWHAELLRERTANPSPRPNLSIDEVRTRILERLNARRTQG